MADTSWKKEWDSMISEEKRFLKNAAGRKESPVDRLLADRVPEKLQSTLEAAFFKAFQLIFEKGTGIIEKTYDKDDIRESYDEQKNGTDTTDAEAIRNVSSKASGSAGKNLALSGAGGIGMGILGIGLPDIPVFTGMLLKGLYEIALNYGYDYTKDEERYFILKLIETSMQRGDVLHAMDAEINGFIDSPELPAGYDQTAQIRQSARELSGELLYTKFLQSIPVVGAVGGAYDAIYMQRILKYAKIKYRRRFLSDHKFSFFKNSITF